MGRLRIKDSQLRSVEGKARHLTGTWGSSKPATPTPHGVRGCAALSLPLRFPLFGAFFFLPLDFCIFLKSRTLFFLYIYRKENGEKNFFKLQARAACACCLPRPSHQLCECVLAPQTAEAAIGSGARPRQRRQATVMGEQPAPLSQHNPPGRGRAESSDLALVKGTVQAAG